LIDKAKEEVEAVERELGLAQLDFDSEQEELDQEGLAEMDPVDSSEANGGGETEPEDVGEPLDEELDPEIARLERALRKAQAKFEKLESEPLDPLVRAMSIFEEDANTFANLERYETTLFRSFPKALSELQRLQAARTGRKNPLSNAIDVDVS
jgi:hypothetical protein